MPLCINANSTQCCLNHYEYHYNRPTLSIPLHRRKRISWKREGTHAAFLPFPPPSATCPPPCQPLPPTFFGCVSRFLCCEPPPLLCLRQVRNSVSARRSAGHPLPAGVRSSAGRLSRGGTSRRCWTKTKRDGNTRRGHLIATVGAAACRAAFLSCTCGSVNAVVYPPFAAWQAGGGVVQQRRHQRCSSRRGA